MLKGTAFKVMLIYVISRDNQQNVVDGLFRKNSRKNWKKNNFLVAAINLKIRELLLSTALEKVENFPFPKKSEVFSKINFFLLEKLFNKLKKM